MVIQIICPQENALLNIKLSKVVSIWIKIACFLDLRLNCQSGNHCTKLDAPLSKSTRGILVTS